MPRYFSEVVRQSCMSKERRDNVADIGSMRPALRSLLLTYCTVRFLIVRVISTALIPAEWAVTILVKRRANLKRMLVVFLASNEKERLAASWPVPTPLPSGLPPVMPFDYALLPGSLRP